MLVRASGFGLRWLAATGKSRDAHDRAGAAGVAATALAAPFRRDAFIVRLSFSVI
jgi:hypothetical protein